MPARASFQLKLFLAALSAAVLALAVAGVLFAISIRRQTDARIEQTIVAEARLAADLVGRTAAPDSQTEQAPRQTSRQALRQGSEQPAASISELDGAADRIGELIGARVTLIEASGRVVGDSAETPEDVAAMENHATRPEVVEARQTGLGRSRRFSDTVKTDMLYVAVPVRHPAIAFVRVALPLADIRHQLQTILTATLTALGLALIGAAAIALAIAGRIGQRVRAVAEVARRYRQGDLTPPRLDYGDDELGAVARALDESVQELGGRLAELARDRARMAAILAGMVEGVIVVDPQGRLQLVNDAARQMLKLDPLAIGRHYVETIRHPAIADLVGAALAGRTPDSVHLSPPRDAARTIMARAATATAGGAHGAVLVLHDITELRRTDQIRRDFVANVSHELRTPLTAVRGYVEALSEDDVGPDDSRRFLDTIARHTLRMERIVRDLLRLAGLDARQETLDVVSCDTRGLVQSVVADLTPSLDQRAQRVDIFVGAGADAARGDAAKLHDALQNLIANASTYAPDGTLIRVEASLAGDQIAIAVSDEGPGIPEEDLSRIFERFYRVDKSRGRDQGGTGLGLAIVKHLVELHGGRVRAENRPEGGARFTIVLPNGT